jgi:hypothetical protein
MTATIRWSGAALVLGAVLLGVALAGASAGRTQPAGSGLPAPTWATALVAVGAILVLLGLPQAHAAQARANTGLSLVAFMLLQAGWVLAVVVTTAPLLYRGLPGEPGESVAALVLGTMLAVGFILTGIVIIQAGVFAPWIGYVILAAAAGFVFLFFVAEFLPAIATRLAGVGFGLLAGIGLASLGVSMWIRP